MNDNERAGIATAPTAAPSLQEATLTELITGIVNDATKFIGQHIDMLKAEVREDMNRTKEAGQLAGYSVVMLTISGLALIFGVVRFMDWVFPSVAEWVWWAVLALGFGGGGALCGYASKNVFQSFSPLPEKTYDVLQENLSWIAKSQK
jgi:hypothetical protein